MTRTLRVIPTAASRLPGDEAHLVDSDQAAGEAPTRKGTSPQIAARPAASGGPPIVEVVVDGWRFELEVEDAGRAELRDRATRDRAGSVAGGRLEIRAIIPGRIAALAVVPGDTVESGQTLLVVEAMKMQNEVRAARAGTVALVPVAAGATIEAGDVLVVLE
jgi:oxaloacetate decarboxylase alpha subunit